mmetsp:Transcript_90067/g.241498  ORF Transcript_90067/g.241498 Transcript_90067/m.241498 type:complete len:315 (+) Transcript_90067:124-1068(+)
MGEVLRLREVWSRNPAHENGLLSGSQVVLSCGHTGSLHEHSTITVDELVHPRLLAGDYDPTASRLHPHFVTPHVLPRRAAIHPRRPVLHPAAGIIVHDRSDTVGGPQLVAHGLEHINSGIRGKRDLARIRVRRRWLRWHNVVVLAIFTTGPVRFHVRVVHVGADHDAKHEADDQQDGQSVLPTRPDVREHDPDPGEQRRPDEDGRVVVEQKPHQGEQAEHQPRDECQEHHRRVALVGGGTPLAAKPRARCGPARCSRVAHAVGEEPPCSGSVGASAPMLPRGWAGNRGRVRPTAAAAQLSGHLVVDQVPRALAL